MYKIEKVYCRKTNILREKQKPTTKTNLTQTCKSKLIQLK